VTLAQTIARVLGDQELRARMARANKLKVKEFAPDIVAKKYLELLSSVAAQTRRRRRQNPEAGEPHEQA